MYHKLVSVIELSEINRSPTCHWKFRKRRHTCTEYSSQSARLSGWWPPFDSRSGQTSKDLFLALQQSRAVSLVTRMTR